MAKQELGKILGWIASGTVLAGVLALIVFIGVVLWRQADTDRSDVGHVSGRTYSLPEWSAYMDAPKELEKETNHISVGYYKDSSTGADAYYLISQELKDAKFLCTQGMSLETNGAFMKVERSYKQPPSAPVKSRQVGNYYYWITNALFQGQCYGDDLMSKYFGPDTKPVFESIRTESKS